MSTRAAVAALLAMVTTLTLAAGAQAVYDPFVWGTPAPILHQAPWTTGALVGPTCPSASFCAIADDDAGVYTTSTPTGGKPAWTRATVGQTLTDLSCASATLCVGIAEGGKVAWSTTPSVSSVWSTATVTSSAELVAVSCPTTTLCVVADDAGYRFASTNPTGGGSTWTTVGHLADGISTDVSCTSSVCVATDELGRVSTSSTPATAGSWSFSNANDVTLSGVTCVPGLCLAVNAYGDIERSTNPTGGAAAWTTMTTPVTDITAVTCASTAYCAVTTAGGDIWFSTNVTTSAPSWSQRQVAPGVPLTGAACPTTTACILTTSTGSLLSTSTPTGSASEWGNAQLGEPFNDVISIACPDTGMCVAGDATGNIATTSNPTAGGAITWVPATVSAGHAIWGISCPAANLCVAGDSAGRLLTSTNPGGGAGSWTARSISPNHVIYDVSCPTTTFCAAVDSAGQVLTSVDPLAGAWATTPVSKTGLFTVACGRPDLCVAGTSGGMAWTSTNPQGGGGAWASASLTTSSKTFLGSACTADGFCALVGDHGARLTSVNPTGGKVAWIYSGSAGAWLDVSCTPKRLCVTVEQGGKVAGSREPDAGEKRAWRSSKVDAAGLRAVSCASNDLCVATDHRGSGVVARQAAPDSTAAPLISGDLIDGGTLTASNGIWEGEPTSFTYQWQRCDVAGNACIVIAGVTGSTLTLGAAHVGATIRVSVTAVNAGGTKFRVAAQTLPVQRAPIGTITIGRLKFTRGILRIPLTCRGAAYAVCATSTQLRVRERLRGRRIVGFVARARVRTKVVTLGTQRSVLRAGQSITVSIRPAKALRKLPRRYRRVPASVRVTVQGGRMAGKRLVIKR